MFGFVHPPLYPFSLRHVEVIRLDVPILHTAPFTHRVRPSAEYCRSGLIENWP